MKSNRFSITRVSALLVASVLFCGGALAEKPEWAGGGKAQKHEQKHEQKEKAHKNEGAKREIQVGSYFVSQQRVAVRDTCGPSPGRSMPTRSGQEKQWLHASGSSQEMDGRPTVARRRCVLPRTTSRCDPPRCASAGIPLRPCGKRYFADRAGHKHGHRRHSGSWCAVIDASYLNQ